MRARHRLPRLQPAIAFTLIAASLALIDAGSVAHAGDDAPGGKNLPPAAGSPRDGAEPTLHRGAGEAAVAVRRETEDAVAIAHAGAYGLREALARLARTARSYRDPAESEEFAARAHTIAGAFRLSRPEDRRAVLTAAVAGTPPMEERLAVLGAVWHLPAAESLEFANQAARPPADDALPGAVLDAYQSCVEILLREDSGTVPALRPALASAGSEARLRIVRACADTGSWRAWEVALAVLEDGQTGPAVLEPLARLVAPLPPSRRTQVTESIRALVASSNVSNHVSSNASNDVSNDSPRDVSTYDPNDASWVREAALAAGSLRDDGAAESLIHLLDAPSLGVRDAALWALRRISGLDLRESAERWSAWLTDERDWLRERGPAVERMLASDELAEVTEALNEITSRTLGRDHWAVRVAPLSRHPDANVRSAALVLLRHLNSIDAVPELLATFDCAAAEIAVPAAAAIRDLTGVDPADRRRAEDQGWR